MGVKDSLLHCHRRQALRELANHFDAPLVQVQSDHKHYGNHHGKQRSKHLQKSQPSACTQTPSLFLHMFGLTIFEHNLSGLINPCHTNVQPQHQLLLMKPSSTRNTDCHLF